MGGKFCGAAQMGRTLSMLRGSPASPHSFPYIRWGEKRVWCQPYIQFCTTAWECKTRYGLTPDPIPSASEIQGKGLAMPD